MRILFFGSVEFSKHALSLLISEGHEIIGVCTLESSEFNSDFYDLSIISKKNNIPFLYVNHNNEQKTILWIHSLKPDVIYCFGWSRLLSDKILKIAPLGVVGYHPAYLPKNRGRHPIIWALSLGLEITASTFFIMESKADSGDIISQVEVPITHEDDANSLYNKLIVIALDQIRSFTPLLASNKIFAKKQNHKLANIWRKRTPKDGIIDWRMSSKNIRNLIRALTKPYCGASFIYKCKEYKVWESELTSCDQDNIEPGKILRIYENNTLIVKCGEGAIKLTKMDAFNRLEIGEYL
ncbi:formyltransferase family protein [Prochlorococcus sp. MIT 1307]|uniref:formyltransferase family protein n=1 Tax=Prochlorococcus sp. MIT 1307 TaxID=3096219 RepID=UPI002A757C6F|nr:formyltransferase family protein [Prochlorococcus sp. MIT 1307]